MAGSAGEVPNSFTALLSDLNGVFADGTVEEIYYESVFVGFKVKKGAQYTTLVLHNSQKALIDLMYLAFSTRARLSIWAPDRAVPSCMKNGNEPFYFGYKPGSGGIEATVVLGVKR